MKLQLNPEQQQASAALLSFLSSPNQVFVLKGAGGTGKTQLLRHFRDELFPQYLQTCKILGADPMYQGITFTAMTNKAAEAMSELAGGEAQTLHSALGLKVEKDRSRGETHLVPKGFNNGIRANEIVVVDEASMLDSTMLYHLRSRTYQCKWLLVGDPNQLPPVKSVNGCPAFVSFQDQPTATLTQPMRNATQPALMELCRIARDLVTNLDFSVFKDGLPETPGVITHLTREELEPVLLQYFACTKAAGVRTPMARILAYTNERVLEYNQWIQGQVNAATQQVNQTGYLAETILVNNRAFSLGKNNGPIVPVERLLKVLEADSVVQPFSLDANVAIQFRYTRVADLITGDVFTLQVPEDPEHVLALLKYYKRKRDWRTYYNIEESFPDLRPFYAATVHKAQGSTYKHVLIDLEDLGYCTNPRLLARLLYVAVSRASDRIFLYGQLPQRLFTE